MYQRRDDESESVQAGPREIGATAVMSRAKLNLRLSYSVVFRASADVAGSRVRPSHDRFRGDRPARARLVLDYEWLAQALR